MDDQVAGLSSNYDLVANPTTLVDFTSSKEEGQNPNEATQSSTSHLESFKAVPNEATQQVNASRNGVPEISFTSETMEPSVGVIGNSKIPSYSKNGPVSPIPMSTYQGPYVKLRFEERFEQEHTTNEQDKSEYQSYSKITKQDDLSDDWSEKALLSRSFYKLGDISIPRFWYEPGRCLPLDSLFSCDDRESILIEIRIAAEHLTLYNPSVKSRNIWGENLYTEDSDLVAAVMHSGYIFLGYTSPNTFVELAVLIQVTKYHSETYFPSIRRFCYQSREWKQESGYLYTILCVAVVLAGGTVLQLQSLPLSDFNFINLLRSQNTRDRVLELPHWPISFRSYSSEKLNIVTSEEIFCKYYTINLSNELCLCYSLSLFLDNDLDSQSWFSQRLKSEVVYLETYSERYELALNSHTPSFRFSLVTKPEKLDYQATFVLGVPLPLSHVTSIEENLQWNEILWGVTKVRIRNQLYHFQRVMFLPRTTPTLQEDRLMDTSK
ncbi:hypothetical protein GpartN1_g4466.t1 [Galdieria partita]|uniref:Uncharacterized protein n=1 Tax=Galdieria partita TaxID=83374 RepID=A0A9C7PYA2_9RHOD|nr:hypothetical protein GpartN1_g4466.t1 [Galdieria partita]